MRVEDSLFSEPIKIILSSKGPIVLAQRTTTESESGNQVEFKGKTYGRVQDPQEKLKDDLYFHHKDHPIHVALPTERGMDV